MASRKGINEARLKKIYSRQQSPGWGGDYLPSILATPQEAPSQSRAFTLTPKKLQGRETHVLSKPELHACLLGLYHPHVVGLQEQRMLSPNPCQHPLWTFTGVDRTSLPALQGIIDVADRLGYLSTLPRLKVHSPNDKTSTTTLIFPWIGDLLWAVQPTPERIHCLNWSVKEKDVDFKRPFATKAGQPANAKRSTSILARHEIEEVYYMDGGIVTHKVSDERIDHHVSANLRQLFLHHRIDLQLTHEQRAELLHKFQTALELDITPAEVIHQLAERGRYAVNQSRSFLWQAIWNRDLRVDLFHPILINRPLRPEERDVIDVYAAWFKG